MRTNVLRCAVLLGILAPKLRAGVHHSIAANENLIECPFSFQVARVQRQPAACVRAHRFQEACLFVFVWIANTGPNPVAAIEKRSHNPSANETRSAGHSHCAALGDGRHPSVEPPNLRTS
jgi:hypothetical protein